MFIQCVYQSTFSNLVHRLHQLARNIQTRITSKKFSESFDFRVIISFYFAFDDFFLYTILHQKNAQTTSFSSLPLLYFNNCIYLNFNSNLHLLNRFHLVFHAFYLFICVTSLASFVQLVKCFWICNKIKTKNIYEMKHARTQLWMNSSAGVAYELGLV